MPRKDIHAQLLAVVSHVKTPLNGIVGCAQLLQLIGTMGNEDRKHVKIIAHCSALLDMMIHNILLHQNSENQTPVLEDTDVRSMFQGVLGQSSCQFQAHCLSPHTEALGLEHS